MPKPETIAAAEARSVGLRLLKDALPQRWKLYTLSLICMICVAGSVAALAYSTRLIVNDVFVAQDIAAGVQVGLLVIAVTAAKALFTYANSVIMVMFNRSVSAAFQKTAFRKILEKDVRHFAGRHAAAQMARVRVFGQACGKTVVGMSNKFLVDILTLVGLVIVMILQDPLMTLVTGLIFPLIFFTVSSLSRRVRAAATAETELTGAMFAVGSEAFAGIKTVKSYRLEEKSIRKFEEAVEALERRLFGIARLTSATVPLMELLGGIVIGSFVVYAAWQTITYGKTPGEFTAFIAAFVMAYQPAQRISKVWVELQKTLVQVARMYDIFDEPVRQGLQGNQVIDPTDPRISFEQVSFNYTPRRPALREVTFEVRAGEWVAVVGRSGAGKSTLVDLLMRFYDPTSGTVRIGGVDLREVSEESIRNTIALISQDVFLFDGTLRENIRDGNPAASDADIDLAVQRAQLSDFVASMPHGLDTQVGPNGQALSGGQKQRVGIARAMVKRAGIYIFDEATSALDAENEQKLMTTLASQLTGVTVLFVTHRASTIAHVDRVLMLENGALVADNTPDSLRATNLPFRSLFNLKEEGRRGVA